MNIIRTKKKLDIVWFSICILQSAQNEAHHPASPVTEISSFVYAYFVRVRSQKKIVLCKSSKLYIYNDIYTVIRIAYKYYYVYINLYITNVQCTYKNIYEFLSAL